MEFIEGQPIDEYCQQRRLTVPDRLNLFLQVCSAVEYAHQRLIIHRDLKPANILVTQDGTPKLLDFGIAKVLDPNATENLTHTMTLLQAMTPIYASPEQIKGEPITTASDVYSLGVVLYELLAGRSPYRLVSHTTQEVTRAICEQEPLRPSTAALQPQSTEQGESDFGAAARVKLSQRLRGDLDNILLMALRKEPQRRYASVEQFAEDIQRHLQKLPVIARQGTVRYRAGRFILRHKAGVVAAAVTALALIAGLAVSLHEARVARAQAVIAQQQRARAERRFNDVRKLANSLMFELHDSIQDLPGSTPARKLLVSRALEYLDSLSAEAKTDTSLQRELAVAYEKIGDVQGQPRQANLGDPAGAAVSYKKALAIRESLATADPADAEVRRQLAPNYGKLSDLQWAAGDFKSAMESSSKALTAAETLARTNAATAADRMTFATFYMDYGYKQVMIGGDRKGGLENLQKGSAMLEQLVAEDPNNLRARRMLGLSYSRLAGVLADDASGRSDALALYKKAIGIKQALVEAEPTNAEFRRLVAYDKFAVGELLADMKQQEDAALAQDREALAEFQKLADADRENAQLRQDIGRVRENMGEILVNLNQPASAIEQFRLSLAALEKLVDARNVHTLVGFTVISDELGMGKAQVRLASSGKRSSQEVAQHCREARSWFSKCLPGFEEIRDHAPPQYGGAARVSEIESEMNKCEGLLRAADTDTTH
jgi:non-specific serine/threonine protein kinase/serine/threonine-protein kinase